MFEFLTQEAPPLLSNSDVFEWSLSSLTASDIKDVAGADVDSTLQRIARWVSFHEESRSMHLTRNLSVSRIVQIKRTFSKLSRRDVEATTTVEPDPLVDSTMLDYAAEQLPDELEDMSLPSTASPRTRSHDGSTLDGGIQGSPLARSLNHRASFALVHAETQQAYETPQKPAQKEQQVGPSPFQTPSGVVAEVSTTPPEGAGQSRRSGRPSRSMREVSKTTVAAPPSGAPVSGRRRPSLRDGIAEGDADAEEDKSLLITGTRMRKSIQDRATEPPPNRGGGMSLHSSSLDARPVASVRLKPLKL
jgi:hypothetical protein